MAAKLTCKIEPKRAYMYSNKKYTLNFTIYFSMPIKPAPCLPVIGLKLPRNKKDSRLGCKTGGKDKKKKGKKTKKD